MKKLWLGIVGLAAASTTHAAVVTYTLSRGETNTGTVNASSFVVYATVAPGAESFGLFAYGVDLGGVPFAITERAPGGFWDADDNDPNFDPAAQYPSRSGAFTILRAQSPTGAVSGAMDPSAYDPDPAKNNLVIVKGIGQVAGNMTAIPGPTYGPASAPVASKAFAPITNADTAYGTPRNNAFTPTLPAGTVKLFNGTISSGSINSLIIENTLDTKAGVFKNNDPNSVDTEANNTINIAYRTFSVTAGGTDSLVVANTAVGANQAVGGSIAVTGSNNKYVSEVDQLLDPAVNKGSALVSTIGDEGGFLWVMAKITGTAADITAVQGETAINNGAAADSATANALHAIYDSQFGAGGFNLLYRQANIPGTKNVNFDFSGHTSIAVDQMAVVPEPASMGLLAFAGLGLAARRRRKA